MLPQPRLHGRAPVLGASAQQAMAVAADGRGLHEGAAGGGHGGAGGLAEGGVPCWGASGPQYRSFCAYSQMLGGWGWLPSWRMSWVVCSGAHMRAGACCGLPPAPPAKLMQPFTPGGWAAHRATVARPPTDWPSKTMWLARAQGCWRTQSSAARWAAAAARAVRSGWGRRRHWPLAL